MRLYTWSTRDFRADYGNSRTYVRAVNALRAVMEVSGSLSVTGTVVTPESTPPGSRTSSPGGEGNAGGDAPVAN
jgi:hypothetical protein